MRRATILVAGCLLAAVTRPSAQQPDPLKAAAEAIGATSIKRLHVSAIGAIYSVGQSPSPKEPWPRVTDQELRRGHRLRIGEHARRHGAHAGCDSAARRWRAVHRRTTADSAGERQRRLERSPATGRRQGGAAPAAAPAPAADPQPQPGSAIERRQQIYLTPHGFLRGALANQASVKTVPAGTEVSFAISGLSTFTGILNSRNQVEHVQTSIDNPVLGDMLVEATYNDYETAGSLSFPMHILQKQGGHPSLELWVSNVQSNVPVDITVPAAVRGAAAPPVRVEAQKLAEGVYYLTGGSHHSVAIDMGDHTVGGRGAAR